MHKNFRAIIVSALCAAVCGAVSLSAQPLDDAGAKAAISELSGKDPAKKLEAARKLGASGRADARKALLGEFKRQKNPALKRAVVEAMASDASVAGDASVIAAARSDADPETRASAAWTLGFSKDPAAYRALIGLMLDAGEPDELRVRAASSLSNFQNAEVFAAYASAMSAASAEVRKTAAMMAVSCFSYDKDALRPHLTRLASDPDARTAAYASRVLADWEKKEKARR